MWNARDDEKNGAGQDDFGLWTPFGKRFTLNLAWPFVTLGRDDVRKGRTHSTAKKRGQQLAKKKR